MRNYYLTPQQVALLRGESPDRKIGLKSAIIKLQKRGLLDEQGAPTEVGQLYLARFDAKQMDSISEAALIALKRIVTISELAAEFADGDPVKFERWRERLKKQCQRAAKRGENWCRRSGDTWLIYAPYARRRWAARIRPEDLD